MDPSVTQGVYAAGGQLTVNGTIGRNARVVGGQIEFASGSRMAGGGEQMEMPRGIKHDGQGERRLGDRGSWRWTIGLIVLALTLVGALPALSRDVAEAYGVACRTPAPASSPAAA